MGLREVGGTGQWRTGARGSHGVSFGWAGDGTRDGAEGSVGWLSTLTPACSHQGLCLAFLLPLLFFPQALLSANSPEPQKIPFHLLFGTAQGSSSQHGQRGKG